MRLAISARRKLLSRYLRVAAVLLILVGTLTYILANTPKAQAAIALRGASVTASNTSVITGSLVFSAMPTGVVAGDVLVAVISVYSASATVTMPAGWNLLPANSSSTATNMKSFVYYAVATGTMSGITVTHTAQKSSGVIMAFSGVDNTTPFADTSVVPKVRTTAATALTTNAFSASNASGSVIVAAFGGYNVSSATAITVSAVAGTTPTMACATTCASTGTNVKTAPLPYSSMEYGTLASAATVTARSMTAAQTMVSNGFVFALKPFVAPTYTQSSYRLFNTQAGTQTLGTPLAAQNTPASISEQTSFSLRQLVSVDSGSSGASAGGKSLKLQAAPKTTTCGTYADVASSGATVSAGPTVAVNDVGNQWTNPTSVAATDGSAATATGASGLTANLKTTGFGFTVPANATISSVRAMVLSYYTTGGGNPAITEQAKLVVGGTVTGNASITSMPGGAYGMMQLGGTPATWGVALAPTDINNANFGVAVRVNSKDDGGVAISSNLYIDSIALQVTYSLPITSSGLFLDYINNSSYDNTAFSADANDPTSARPIVLQSTVASSPFVNRATISNGSDGLWDIRLTSGPGTGGTTYCLKLVDSSGAALNTYSYVPEVAISAPPAGPALSQQLRGGQAVREGLPDTPLVSPGQAGW